MELLKAAGMQAIVTVLSLIIVLFLVKLYEKSGAKPGGCGCGCGGAKKPAATGEAVLFYE
jgi:hypothetical protein